MAFDTILNATWMAAGLLSLAYLLTRRSASKPNAFSCIGAMLVVAALFPVISATDDIIRLEHSQRQNHSKSGNTEHKRFDETLVRLYEAIESPMAVTPVRISFVAFFLSLTFPLCESYEQKHTLEQKGRSPPRQVFAFSIAGNS